MRSASSKLLVVPLLAGAFLLNGCESLLGRFIVRTLEHATDPIAPAPIVNTKPILDSVGIAVLWVGHATTVIQIFDKIFVTDPVFTNSVGMIVRRAVAPGLDPKMLTRVDYILISHTHFDHFSYGSLDMLPKSAALLIPPGSAEYTPDFGFKSIREMHWWSSIDEDSVRITAVPVQHFGGRYGFDNDWNHEKQYTSYVIEYKGKTVFFGGDMGYHAEYSQEIGRRFRIDVALIPIAPVAPRSFMSRVHVDPKDAVQVFEDLRARYMIPIHYRTFFQGFDPQPDYAATTLAEIIKERKLQDRIFILNIGEQKILE